MFFFLLNFQWKALILSSGDCENPEIFPKDPALLENKTGYRYGSANLNPK